MKLLTGFPWLPIEPHSYTSADTGGAEKLQKRLIYSNRTVTKCTLIRQSTTCMTYQVMVTSLSAEINSLYVTALYSVCTRI